jgi:hypothetical protein
LFAETVAIGVRPDQSVESAGVLTDLVEQGAMDYMFGSGHIVFDLSVDPTNQFYAYLALDQSRRGGARVTVLMDVSFDTVHGKGLLTDAVEFSVLDALSEDVIFEGIVSARDIEDFDDLDPIAIAERVGGLVAHRASESMHKRRSE